MPDRPSQTKSRRRLRTAVLVGLQVLLILVGVELGLRLIGPGHAGLRGLLYQAGVATDFDGLEDLADLMQRSMLGYRPFETHRGFILNSRSFRTPEYSREKRRDTLRAVTLGDSFTYGAVPHEWNWTSLLAKGLAATKSYPGVELLNLGVPGTGLPFQLRLWDLEASGLGSDIVVLMFFVGNDLVEEMGGGPGVAGFVDKVATVSHTVRVVRNLWRARSGREAGGGMAAPAPAKAAESGGYELPGYAVTFDESRPTFTEEAYLELEAERMEVCLLDQALELSFRADRVVDLMVALEAGVESSGGRLLVVLAPDEYQVSPDLAERVARAAGRAPAEYDLEAPQRYLAKRLEGAEIEYLDLLPALREAARREEVYLPRDTHWNRAGNQVAAREILELLR